MKKVAAVIVALFAVMVLTSCGAATTASGEASSTVAGETGAAAPSPVVALEVPRAFEVSQNTPQFFQDVLKQKEPILLMFYAEDSISQEVMKAVQETYGNENYAGEVEFLLLKIDDSEEITELARDFAVGYIPFTAIVNRDGQVIFEKKGYVDTKVLEQALYIATNK